MFPINEAAWDRLVRLVVGAAMAWLGLSGSVPPPWEAALVVFAFYPFMTAAIGWDPVYVLIGFRGTGSRSE